MNGLFGKIDQIRQLIDAAKKNIHIFGISEPHLSNIIQDTLVSIDGYNIIQKDRTSGKSGGVEAISEMI